MVDRVLIVDDDAFCRDFLRRILERKGYKVSEAETAEEAVALEERHPSCVVVTDFNLSDGDGVGLARQLRSKRRDQPVILVTGGLKASTPDEDLAVFSRVLQKPFRPDAIEAAVAAVMCPV